MMAVKVRQKSGYYILGILAVVFLAFLGPLRTLEDGSSISVAVAVMRLPQERLWESSVGNAFSACATSWLYVLLAMIAAFPSASYLYEELVSRFYMGVEQRMGKYRYVYSRLFYAASSGGVLAGAASYALAISFFFPLNSYYGGVQETWGEEAVTVASLALSLGGRILYMAFFGMAMSMLAASLIFLYPDLYACLGLMFILAYLLKEAALAENMLFPLGMAASLLAADGVLWKMKGGRV